MKKLFTLSLALLAALFGTQTAQAQNAYAAADLSVGDSIQVDDVWYIVGKNIATNGDFDEDPSENNGYIVGWIDGSGAQMTSTYMNWNETGGYDDGPYISTMGNYGASSRYSIGQHWAVDSESKYYFTFWVQGLTGENQYIMVTMSDEEPSGGGDETNHILGMSGDGSDGILGYVNYSEDGSWVNTSVTISTEEHSYLRFSARWCSGHGFDGFGLYKLYDPETTTKADLLDIILTGLQEEGYDMIEDLYDAGCEVYAADLETVVYEEVDEALMDMDEETLEAVIAKVETMLTEAESLITSAASLVELLAQAESYAELGYLGLADLESAINNAQDFIDNGYGDLETTNAQVSALEEAINTYLFSQEATADNPADYTFLISSPYFLSDNDLVEISYQDDNAGIASISYTNEADYSEGSAPSDGSSSGWYVGTSGGDQRLNYWAGRVCWNAWRTGTFTVALYQDLEDIPDGIYTVSAEMVTQSTCITDQHIVANGSSSTISPTLTKDDSETWEWLTTDKVLVLNGKLTIGAEGSQLYDEDGNVTAPSDYSDNRGGWFLVTNFRLLYYGEASDEEIAEYYNSVVAEAQALVDSVYYAADKASLQAYIATYGSVTSGYGDAIDSLNYAIEEAQASIEKYAAVSEGSLLDVQTYISDGTYSTNQSAIAQTLVDIVLALEAADDATYTAMDDYTTIIRYYRDSYLPVLAEAEALTISDATAQAAMAATIASQVEELTAISALPTTDELDEYIAELESAIAVCQAQDVLASGETDLSTLIINATVDATGNYVVPDGWTASYNTGDKYSYTGQAYDDDSSNRYFDCWTSTAGLVDYTAYQTITVPNGVYELSAKMRSTGTTAADSETGVGQEGVYLFAIDGGIQEDTLLVEEGATAVFAPAHVQATDSNYVDSSIEKGTSYGYFTDSYGPIWAEAYDAVQADNYTDLQDAIAGVNSGIGRGWFYNSLQITVTNRTLTVGVTTDSILTAGHTDTEGNACVPFSGNWFSADDFTLTLITNNDPNFNLADGIESVATEQESSSTIKAIYSLDGRQLKSLDNAPAGIYIIRQEGKTIKVLKK